MRLRPRQSHFVERSLAALCDHGNTLSIASTGFGKTIALSAVVAKSLEGSDAKACIDIGMGRAALTEAKRLIAARGRLAPEAIGHGHTSYLDDTHILYRFGEWETRQCAAELLQEAGARALDAVADGDDAQAIGLATLDIAKAKTFGGDTALRMASDLFEFGGAGAANRTEGLDRIWRNLRVHTLHDASWWKYAQIGEHALSGKLPPPLAHQ